MPARERSVFYMPATKPMKVEDRQLREAVMREIDYEPEIRSTDISVAAEDHIVTLTGFVHAYMEKVAAEKAAKRVYGVKAVANDIQVKLEKERTDPEIARDAVEALVRNVSVPDTRIKVTVNNGQIAVEGKVDWSYQKDAAEAAVRDLLGVKGVFNRIEVEPSVSTGDVRAKIEEALRRRAEVDARRVIVEAHEGTVVLRGNVRSWGEKDEAAHAAWAAPGVRRVENNITVTP
jgi:osmotically-inducible protein OsmY